MAMFDYERAVRNAIERADVEHRKWEHENRDMLLTVALSLLSENEIEKWINEGAV